MTWAGGRIVTLSAALGVSVVGVARADLPVPPWIDPGDVPPPTWARSIVPKAADGRRPGDLQLFVEANRAGGRRGATAAGAGLPFFGSRRGSGCTGRWWLVGPLAWTCSDSAELSPAEPVAPPPSAGAGGLTASYYFAKADGAGAYVSLDSVSEGSPDRDLEGGWGVAIVEQRRLDGDGGERWGRTSHGLWIAMRDLVPSRPSSFQGEVVKDGRLDFGWVNADRAHRWSTPSTQGKGGDAPTRLQRVSVFEESGVMVRVDDAAWMLARDLAVPHVAPPPEEVVHPDEPWIDVDLATQTIVAYRGTRPVYATLVSTGRGPAGAETATPRGVHRIWVKIATSDMENVGRDENAAHYALEDVPYVQFFDKAVALHGTYWHGDFGHVRSHGCVNLSPLDARWMFAFTAPHLPVSWVAAYPISFDEGTVVRVK